MIIKISGKVIENICNSYLIFALVIYCKYKYINVPHAEVLEALNIHCPLGHAYHINENASGT